MPGTGMRPDPVDDERAQQGVHSQNFPRSALYREPARGRIDCHVPRRCASFAQPCASGDAAAGGLDRRLRVPGRAAREPAFTPSSLPVLMTFAVLRGRGTIPAAFSARRSISPPRQLGEVGRHLRRRC